VVCPITAFHYEVIDVRLNVPTNLWLEYFPSHSGESWTGILQTLGIRTKQKVPKGVMKLVFSSSSFAI
jgi:hypothetical protein